MARFFRWLALRPKEWAVRFSVAFSGPDASRDRCLYPGCGVMRQVHGKAHRFVEKAP